VPRFLAHAVVLSAPCLSPHWSNHKFLSMVVTVVLADWLGWLSVFHHEIDFHVGLFVTLLFTFVMAPM